MANIDFNPRQIGDREQRKFGAHAAGTDSTLVFVQVGGVSGGKSYILNVNSSGKIGTVIDGYDTIGDGRQTVATAGTRVQLSSISVPCKRITIMAETDNTDYIVLGGSAVVAAIATRRGIPLSAGQSFQMDINDVKDVWMDAVVSTEGITYTFFR